jgi:hypothetical protein
MDREAMTVGQTDFVNVRDIPQPAQDKAKEQAMKIKSLIAFTTSLTVVVAMLPFDLAYAGGSNGGHSYNGGSSGQAGCRNGGSRTNVSKPVNVTNNNIDNSKNTNVYRPVHVTNNVDNSKNTTVNKYTDNSKNTNVTNNYTKNIDNSKNYNITRNIDNSKNYNITKNINNSKYIDNSKNTNITKNININSNNSSSDATAIAAAVAAAVAAASSKSSASVVVNNNGNTTPGGGSTIIGVNAAAAAAAGAAVGGGGGAYISDQQMYQGGNIAVAVDTSGASQQCVFQEATVVKAIHAECVSADGHSFPASHMVGATWLDASYEGEVMRCIPGSTLKVTVGEVVQSDQGMASSFTNGQQLNCGQHEALRHFKDGMLKCAIEVPVPDCTERTNLRRWGTGDMFFSYRTRVCAQTHREYSQISQQQESTTSESSSESGSGEMVLKGMQLDGGIGAGAN